MVVLLVFPFDSKLPGYSMTTTRLPVCCSACAMKRSTFPSSLPDLHPESARVKPRANIAVWRTRTAGLFDPKLRIGQHIFDNTRYTTCYLDREQYQYKDTDQDRK